MFYFNGLNIAENELATSLLRIFTLWLFNIAMQNGTFIDGLAIKKMWFSMAMLNNQMVTNMIEHDSHVLPISHELPGNKGFQSRFLWTIADPSSLKMGYDELTILTILNIAWIDIFLIKYSADTYIYIHIYICHNDIVRHECLSVSCHGPPV